MMMDTQSPLFYVTEERLLQESDLRKNVLLILNKSTTTTN